MRNWAVLCRPPRKAAPGKAGIFSGDEIEEHVRQPGLRGNFTNSAL